MAEYIEREALRDSVESIDWYSVCIGKLTAGAESSKNALYKANDIYAAIDNAPTADVSPVRHGRWIEHSHLEVGGECSVCGWQFQWFENGEAHYCPHCGAKMDLEASDGKA